ncbi:sensor histidine kinase [Streptomyces sp. NPDC057718]|uniref:sensor histidine kinase n=1 Tax=Streptomyces sp. NPDC057718 TaxID=3346225 RepID=UPI003677C3F0
MTPRRTGRLVLRPRSLRGRLLLAVLALAAVVLLALDAVVYGALRGYLLDRTDTTLRAVRQRVAQQLSEPGAEGRLGLALNTMLARQQATQDRLRRFVADASHELRTPVTAVLGYADLHQQGALTLPEQQDRAMDGITREALRMRRLVNDLLLLARLDAVPNGDHSPVDLAVVVHEAVAAARAADPDRPLSVTARDGTEVHGDAEQLRRVLDNLLANVRNHTPPGTAARITVRTTAVTDVAYGTRPGPPGNGRPYDTEAATPGGARVEIEVADEGPGIAAEVLPQVFERFYRAAPAPGGDSSGLGLAIVAAIAEAHAGTVALSSAEGEGTRVTVSLPLDHARDRRAVT